MPSPKLGVEQFVSAEPATVFAHISDLTTHGAWAANDLSIEAADDSELAVGKRYRSHAKVGNLEFDAELIVTEFDVPNAFGFSGNDRTGGFAHRFVVKPAENGAVVSREITFDLTLKQYLFYLLTYYPVRLPAARKALARLKEQLEK